MLLFAQVEPNASESSSLFPPATEMENSKWDWKDTAEVNGAASLNDYREGMLNFVSPFSLHRAFWSYPENPLFVRIKHNNTLQIEEKVAHISIIKGTVQLASKHYSITLKTFA